MLFQKVQIISENYDKYKEDLVKIAQSIIEKSKN